MNRVFKIEGQIRKPWFDIGLLNKNSVKEPLKSNKKTKKKILTIQLPPAPNYKIAKIKFWKITN